jgi:hypothetical protein
MAPPRPPTTGPARKPCTEDPAVVSSRSSGFARATTGAAHRTAARQIAGRSPSKPFSSRPGVSPCRSGVLILTATNRTGEHRFHEPLPVASRSGNLCQMWRVEKGSEPREAPQLACRALRSSASSPRKGCRVVVSGLLPLARVTGSSRSDSALSPPGSAGRSPRPTRRRFPVKRGPRRFHLRS